jgi:hypothetical protein
MDAAKLWMIEHQLGQRNLNNDQRSYWIGKHYELEKKRHGGDRKSSCQNGNLKTAQSIAEQHKVGERTVARDSKFTHDIDTIADNIGDVERDLAGPQPGMPWQAQVAIEGVVGFLFFIPGVVMLTRKS